MTKCENCGRETQDEKVRICSSCGHEFPDLEIVVDRHLESKPLDINGGKADSQYLKLGWHKARMYCAIGGALAILGAVLPWASLDSIFGEVSIPGYKTDGVVVLVIGLIVLLSSMLYAGKPNKMYSMASAFFGVVALIITFIVLVNVASISGETEYTRTTTGLGIYVALLGGLFMLGGITKSPEY